MSIDTVPAFLNPVAGRGRAEKSVTEIRDLLQQCPFEVDIKTSCRIGDIEERIFSAAQSGADKIIVAGGDGSIHEAVNGLLRAGTETALGIIPIGTGNDFAKACAIPLQWQDAAIALLDRITRKQPARHIDAGQMNGRFFANGVGIGFDARVNHIARDMRWRIGNLVYLAAVLKGIREGIITPNVRMRYRDQTWNGPVTLANVSNGPWVGGMFHIAPMASIDDGLLDLVVVAPVGVSRVLALLPKLIKGTHVDTAEVRCRTIESFSLQSDAPIPSHIDGEVQPLQSSFNVKILPGALRVL